MKTTKFLTSGVIQELAKKSQDCSDYLPQLLIQNLFQIIFLALTNIIAIVIVITQIKTLDDTQIRDVLTTSSVLLGITTATIAFFGQYVETATDNIFKIGTKLKQIYRKKNDTERLEKVTDNLPKTLLKVIFLQFFLWWSLMTDGISTLLSFLGFYNNAVKLFGVLALAFMLIGVLTLLIWMSLFIMSNTPGRRTYDALKEEEKYETKAD